MNEISQLVKKIVKELFNIDQDIFLTRPEMQFGDFATNIAMQITKQVGQSPRQIAELIVLELKKFDLISDASVAGPGFINIKLADEVLIQSLSDVVKLGESYSRIGSYSGKKIVTEYSDPNPFKVLHIGHFYTSVIGDAISNLIENAGGEVHRVNFGGDVGLHVAKTMWAIIQDLGGEYPEKLSGIGEDSRSEWMATCYVKGTNAYEENEITKNEITALNKRVYGLHSSKDHESDFAKIYWTCRTWSYDYFNAFYDRIGTKFERYYPESENAQLGLSTIIEQKNNGVYQDSNGAVVFVGEPYGLHTRVFINKEGLPTYEAKDVGLSLKKWEDYHFDESVIITGNDIIEYMKVVLKSIEQFRPELALKTKHLTHGNVKLAGGVKMASRKGNFLRAVDVIEVAADENEKAQGNRNDEPVIGAIKYVFLKNKIGADVIFEPKESVSLQGNSGPYLKYSLARAKSILRKSEKSVSESSAVSKTDLTEFERRLVYKFSEYRDVIELATATLLPHHLCTYLYELAQEFNRFYENSKVAGDEREEFRLSIVFAYESILASGLKILGIPVPDRM